MAAVLQGDGRIVIAGVSNSGPNNDFAINRYHGSAYFDHQFDGAPPGDPTTYGWVVDTVATSNWALGTNVYETTSGSQFGWTSVSYASELYGDLRYEVQLLRTGAGNCGTCATTLYVRGEPLPFVTVQNRWQRGYQFSIATNPARYSIWALNGTNPSTALQPWTSVGTINGFGVNNTLRVIAEGNTFIFIINGVQVAAIPNNSQWSSGKVGIAMTRSNAGLNDTLQVNYAKTSFADDTSFKRDYIKLSPKQRMLNKQARREYKKHPERFGTPEMAPE
jgi:hypothetical protein